MMTFLNFYPNLSAPIIPTLGWNHAYEFTPRWNRTFEGNDPYFQENPIDFETIQQVIDQRLLGQTQENQQPSTPLSQLLSRMTIEESPVIKRALRKEHGYFLRLFSDESWSEWLCDRTALGEVVYQLFCDPRNPEKAISRLEKTIFTTANLQAQKVLSQLVVAPGFTLSSVSCLVHAISSTAVSRQVGNPAPTVLAIPTCFFSFASAKPIHSHIVRDFLDKLQFGKLKTIDDGLKEQLILIGERSENDDTFFDMMAEAIDKATSVVANPVLFALEEFQEALMTAGEKKGLKMVEALKRFKKRVLQRANAHIELGQVRAELSDITRSLNQAILEKSKLQELIDEANNLLEKCGFFFEKELAAYRKDHRIILDEIESMTLRIYQVENGIELLQLEPQTHERDEGLIMVKTRLAEFRNEKSQKERELDELISKINKAAEEAKEERRLCDKLEIVNDQRREEIIRIKAEIAQLEQGESLLRTREAHLKDEL